VSAAIFSKWERLESGMSVIVSPDELSCVRLRDFIQIAKGTGLRVRVEQIRPGWYRIGVRP